MSIISMLVAARTALADRRDRRRAYEELAALDDHSLADIGLHRSQLDGAVERLYESIELDAAPSSIRPLARQNATGLPAAQQWLRRV
jgi:uncharacterized protein YjiS (DUF1127 family)